MVSITKCVAAAMVQDLKNKSEMARQFYYAEPVAIGSWSLPLALDAKFNKTSKGYWKLTIEVSKQLDDGRVIDTASVEFEDGIRWGAVGHAIVDMATKYVQTR